MCEHWIEITGGLRVGGNCYYCAKVAAGLIDRPGAARSDPDLAAQRWVGISGIPTEDLSRIDLDSWGLLGVFPGELRVLDDEHRGRRPGGSESPE